MPRSRWFHAEKNRSLTHKTPHDRVAYGACTIIRLPGRFYRTSFRNRTKVVSLTAQISPLQYAGVNYFHAENTFLHIRIFIAVYQDIIAAVGRYTGQNERLVKIAVIGKSML